MESDLFHFWALLVQVCEAWDISGSTVSQRFNDLFDRSSTNPVSHTIVAACDQILRLVEPEEKQPEFRNSFWYNGTRLSPNPANMAILNRVTVSSLEGDDEKFMIYQILRTLRNSFSHARFNNDAGELQTLISQANGSGLDTPSVANFQFITDARINDSWLIALDCVKSKNSGDWNQDRSRRCIITTMAHAWYHFHLFLRILLPSLKKDIFGNVI